MRAVRIQALLLILALGGAQPVAAGYVADNHDWELTCTADGFQLRSIYPVARFFEGGAASRVTSERETLFLGRSCDAAHKHFGQGSWCWGNGGFRAEFADHMIGFPRQELHCAGAENELTGCGC